MIFFYLFVQFAKHVLNEKPGASAEVNRVNAGLQ